jgi:hypothetical protein
MHILIISHVPLSGTYGAATSLRNHIELLKGDPELKFTVIEQLGYHRGPRVKVSFKISRYSWLLPVVGNYDGYIAGYPRKIYYTARRIFSYFFIGRLFDIIDKLRPDVIHINSLVLLELVRLLRLDRRFDTIRIIASVREVLSSNLLINDINSIKVIDNFICIDKATMVSLLQYSVVDPRNVVVQQNPFIISNSHWSRDLEFKSQFRFIFSISGIITNDKGVLEVVCSFIKLNLTDSVLLVVGGAVNKYSKDVIDVCKASKNVYYLGEIPDLCGSGFFNTIDVVIRGDSSFRTGRTVYEAIYSGAIAILPCVGAEYLGDEQLLSVLNNVIFYRSRDLRSLEKAILASRLFVLHNKRGDSCGKSNTINYIDKFKRIYYS